MTVYSAWTHVGRVRKNNEDAYQIVPLANDGHLFVVADGIGGNAGGEVASQTAVDTIVAQLTSTPYSDLESCRKSVHAAIKTAHAAVLEKSDADPGLEGMGTTLTMLAVLGKQGLIAHAGDSRAYVCRDGKLKQITEDHTLGQEWVRNGKLTPEEALFHPYKHMLTRALGIEPFADADLIDLELQPGDRILLCSDGLSNMVRESRLEELISHATSMEDLCGVLGQEALNRGGHDNITMIAILVEDQAC